MAGFDLIIVGGLVVTAEEVGEYDIGIINEKIAEVAPRGGLSASNAKKTIDAEGGYVMVCFLSFYRPVQILILSLAWRN